MFRSMFTIGGLTFLSRILGLVRDKLIYYFIGTGNLGDIWVAAFQLPNLFRRVFGEGAFNSAFVPLYCRKIEEEGDVSANFFASRVITIMFWLLLLSFALMFIFMGPIVKLTNPGFVESGILDMGVLASRITIGYLIFVCLMAAFSGILNSRKVFGPPAFAYVVLNIVLIVVLILASQRLENKLIALCYGVLVAGVLQLAVLIVSIYRKRIKVGFVLPVIDKDIKKLGLLMVPGLISAGAQQLNILVGGAVASLETGGGRSAIYLSERINQFPLGLIGIAMGVVLLPEISRNLRSGKIDEARQSLAFGVDVAILLCIPAMVAMLVIPKYIMHGIFEGGAVSAESAQDIGVVLSAFAIGMPAYVLTRVYQPGYYARENTRSPMIFAIVGALVNIALCYPLFRWIGVSGCALATSIAGWVSFVLLWFGLKKDGFVTLTGGMLWRYSRMLLSASIMGLAIWYFGKWGEAWLLKEGHFLTRIIALFILVIIGVVVYIISILANRVFTMSEIKHALKIT